MLRVCTAYALRVYCVCTACALRVHCVCTAYVCSARTLHARCTHTAVHGQQAAGGGDVQCKELGANQAVQAAAVAAELTRLGVELRRRCDTLHAPRALALSELRAAAASGDYDELHDALYSAHEAGLQGDFATDGIGPGGRWMTREVRDARLQLFAAAKRRAEEAAAAGQRMALAALRMRGETLGTARWGRRYWRLADQRVWVQPRTPGLAAVVQAVAPDAAGDDAWQLFEGAEVRRSPRHEAGPRTLHT